MDAIFLVDKPIGPTSHDVVARIRRAAGQRRVGHAGTLDPLASGLLIVALGSLTRLLEYLATDNKVYTAHVAFGSATTTDDAEGTIVAQADPSHLTVDTIVSHLGALRGTVVQRPPVFSAISVGGQRLHALARRGIAVEAPLRTVEISDLTLTDWEPPTATLEVSCSKGTYIRSLARDLGESVGTYGHLSGLRRTSSGRFSVQNAPSLETLTEALRNGTWHQFAIPPSEAVGHLPIITLTSAQERDVSDGRPIIARLGVNPTDDRMDPNSRIDDACDDQQGERQALPLPNVTLAQGCTTTGRLVTILVRREGDRWHPHKNLIGSSDE